MSAGRWSPRGGAQVHVIDDASQVGATRRAAMLLAGELGLSETERAAVGVVVTEAAGNIVKHAARGWLILQPLDHDAQRGLEIVAVDSGPGMADPERCLVDGYSTAGTPGTGLGAIRRMAHEFDLHSEPGAGTLLVARFWTGEASAPEWAVVGGVCIPYPGERVSGDHWCVVTDGPRTLLLVVDGLGHGDKANEAALAAVARFTELAPRPPGDLLTRLHEPLRATRGAAILVAEVDSVGGVVRCAGVGNVAGTILTGGQTRSLVSHSGIVGHQMARVQEFSYPWSGDSVLVLASDGLRTQWRLDASAGVTRRHPTLVAALLWRDFTRGRDDATVLVVRARET